MFTNDAQHSTSSLYSPRWCTLVSPLEEVGMAFQTDSALRGRHRFSISTKFMQDYGIDAPVSGATQIVTAKGRRGRLEVFSIGTDQRIHRFTRDAAGKWSRTRSPWKAASLAVVPQRDGTDKVFFAELAVLPPGPPRGAAGHEEKTVTVYELEDTGSEPRRRLLGRFATTDPKVYGVRELSGVQCRDGANILVTALATRTGDEAASWVVLFGHRSSTGALSLGEGKGLVAQQVLVAREDPGSTRWPHVTFVLINDGVARVEWGKRSGVLLQSERIPLPPLADVAEIEVARDHRGQLRIFALDAEHRIHVLGQVDGSGDAPPRFASAWLRLGDARAAGPPPAFNRIRALRLGNGDLAVFALDAEDRLWSISEEADGWSLDDVGINAAHFAAAATDGGRLEVFAVSRENQLLWLRKRDRRDRFRLERIGWDVSASEKTRLDVFRTGLTIFDEERGAVPGVPIRVTATERTPSTVNGLAYAIGPGEPVLAETNAFGKISVTFELTERTSVPALNFEPACSDPFSTPGESCGDDCGG